MTVPDRRLNSSLPGFLSRSGGVESAVGVCDSESSAENAENLPDLWPEGGPRTDRRDQARLAVRWPAVLSQGPAAKISAMVLNISPSGFYCRAVRPVFPGETAAVSIRLPDELNPERAPLFLVCSAVVVRTESTKERSGHGLAFRIRDYVLQQDDLDAGPMDHNLPATSP